MVRVTNTPDNAPTTKALANRMVPSPNGWQASRQPFWLTEQRRILPLPQLLAHREGYSRNPSRLQAHWRGISRPRKQAAKRSRGGRTTGTSGCCRRGWREGSRAARN
jgi:hypothetical protein